MNIEIDDHPLLDAAVFVTTYPSPLGEMSSPDWMLALLSGEAEAPFETSDEIKTAVRSMLRTHGYKPAGRGKPASEYLVRAASEGDLSSINLAVDTCNAVSLHSGLPISVVDPDLLSGVCRIGIGGPDAACVFNAGGQEIKVAGLLCLHDDDGPCANAVRDSQRTKTHPQTTRVLSVVWGTRDLEGRTTRVAEWYKELIGRSGGDVSAP